MRASFQLAAERVNLENVKNVQIPLFSMCAQVEHKNKKKNNI